MAASVTRLIPSLSISLPATGVAIAAEIDPSMTAADIMPRFQPNSAMMGFISTDVENCRTVTLPTVSPRTEPNTIHQRLLDRIRLRKSFHAEAVFHRETVRIQEVQKDAVRSRMPARSEHHVRAGSLQAG